MGGTKRLILSVLVGLSLPAFVVAAILKPGPTIITTFVAIIVALSCMIGSMAYDALGQ